MLRFNSYPHMTAAAFVLCFQLWSVKDGQLQSIKIQRSKLKKHSAALIPKGHLFHSNNYRESKYASNLGLDNELMNSISC